MVFGNLGKSTVIDPSGSPRCEKLPRACFGGERRKRQGVRLRTTPRRYLGPCTLCSKDVLEKCKKGRLFLVVGAERDLPCKRLLATSYAVSRLALSPRLADTLFTGSASREKSNDVSVARCGAVRCGAVR